MTGDPDNSASTRTRFDLEERTARFGEEIVGFAKTIPHNSVTLPLISQLVRAGTSVGANYCEADDAVSKKEFRHKIGTCEKEARETKYWLRIIAKADETLKPPGMRRWRFGFSYSFVIRTSPLVIRSDA